MDESKKKDVCVSATVIVSEHVAGETLVEGSLSERVEGVEDGGGCNGEDIMVEVLGSDVYVDGVCTRGEAGQGGSVEADMGLEGDVKSLGGDGVVSDLGLREVGVSDGEASKLGTENVVESSTEVVELAEERTQVVPVEEGGVVEGAVESGREIDNTTSPEVGVPDDQAQNVKIGTEVDSSLAVVGSMSEETHVVNVEEVAVVAREEGLEGETVKVGADRGREVVGSEGDVIADGNSQKVEALDENARNTIIENGVGGSLVVVDSLCTKTQVVIEEVSMIKSVEVLEKGLIVEGAEHSRKLVDGGVDAANDLKTPKIGVSDDEVWNPGINATVVCTPTIVENLIVQTQVVEEKVEVLVNKEGLDPKNVSSSGSALEVIVSSSGRDQSSMVETVYGGTEKDGVLDANPKSLDNQSTVAAGGVAGINKEAILSSNEGMEIDAIDEKSTCSVDEQLERVEKVGGSSENHSNVSADSVSLSLPNQVVIGGENAVMDDNVLTNSEKDLHSNLEECLPRSIDHDSAQVNSNTGQEMEVDKQVIDAEPVECLARSIDHDSAQINSNTGQEMEVDKQVIDAEPVECLARSIDHDSAQVNSNIGQEMEVDKQVIDAEPARNIDYDSAQVNSNTGQEMEVDKQVIDAEPVHLCGGQVEVEERDVKGVGCSTTSHGNVCEDSGSTQAVVGGEVATKGDKVLSDPKVEILNIDLDGISSCSANDQSLKAETVCGSTEKDSQITDRGEIATMHCEGVLDSNLEVPGPAGKDKPLEFEECLEKAVDIDQVDSSLGEEIKVKEQVANAECADAMPLNHQPTQVVVEAEVASVDGSVLLDSNIEVSDTADMDGMLSCPGNNLNLEAAAVRTTMEADTQVTDSGEIALMDTEEVLNSNNEVPGAEENDLRLPFEDSLDKSGNGNHSQLDSNIRPEMGIEGQIMKAEQVGLQGEQEMEVEEDDADTEQTKTIEEKFVKRASLNPVSVVKVHQASYQLPPENEGEFSVSDLVWGKVRSHPWWPGQIFDPSDSSEKALKHYRKDCFLVAYFGDRTFAWNEASQLKSFRTHFSNIEKHSNSETFQNAVDCALEEVARRVEFGLTCSCIPKDAYDKIKFQIVENTGIRQASSTRDGVDKSASGSSFEPDKLIEYVRALARFPSGGIDRLELVIAKAQLSSFYHSKGHCSLPEFQSCGQLLENDTHTPAFEDGMDSSEVIEHATSFCKDDEQISSGQVTELQNSSSHQRKHNLTDGVFCSKKERSLSELMGGMPDSPDGDNLSDEKTTGKKRKAVDYHADPVPQDGRKTIALAKVSKPSFKIGDCIRRVASQLTGSPSILKGNSERFQKSDGIHDIPAGDELDVTFQDSEDAQRGRATVPTEYSSLDDLLSQLQLAAQDPYKGYSFLNIIVSFFSDFRNSIILGQYSERETLALDKVGSKRKKSSHSVGGLPETFEFEDMSDTYWTDRVIQNGSEEQPSRKQRKKEHQLVPLDLEKPLQVSRRPSSRKRYSDGNHVAAAEKPAGYVDENSPGELLMNFSEVSSVPSETNLNKMFRRFGPLKASETEVDRDTCRARVVFKKSPDAEVAFSSAGRFNIFGPALVNYQLNFTPSALFKASPIDTTQDHEMHLDLAALEVDLV